MSAMPPISETELNAYVDGETFPERQAVIEAWLARNPAQAAKVKAWRRQNQVLRAAFGRIAGEPVPAALLHASRPCANDDRKIAMLAPDVGALRGARPKPQLWDRWGRLALVAAGSFLAGAGVACLAGYLVG